MKISTLGVITAVTRLLASCVNSLAIGGLQIAISGTNLVLSWPSYGYEHYLIQHRSTLDDTGSWSALTNNYPANSTERTAYTIYGVVPPPPEGGGGGGVPSPLGMSSMSMTAADANLILYPLDDATIAMLAKQHVFPPYEWDLQGREPFVWEQEGRPPYPWDPGATRSEALARSGILSLDGAESDGGETDSGGSGDGMGFYRVFHVPDWAFDVTNYTYDTTWFFPVDFADYMDRVENIHVLLNGEPTTYAEFTSHESGGQTNWGMLIDFDRLANGAYQIQLVTTLRLNEQVGDEAASLVLSNLPKSIVVLNQAAFPDWNDFIQGDTYTFKAQLANPNTDWTIDIYDAWGWFVGTGSGHTTDGQVSWTWDLYDALGNKRDDFDSDPYFFSEITFSLPAGGGQTTKTQPLSVKGYPNVGEWLIAFQNRWFSDAWGYPPDLQGKYEDAVSAIWGGPILLGETAQWHPLKLGTNYTQAEREQSWTNLVAWVGDLYVRNFYYHGHGGATALGCDRHTFSTNGLVTGGVFSYPGSKSTIENWQIAKRTKFKRFRFVFLDGCSTASGDLPNAFNVSKTTHTIDFYENHPKHPRPSVFVGWNQVVGGAGWGNAYDRLDFQSFWMGNWVNDADFPSIETALKRANNGAGWISEGQLMGALRIYGYKEMRGRDYNHKGDWRWP